MSVNFVGNVGEEDGTSAGDYPNPRGGAVVNGPENGWPVKVGFFNHDEPGKVAVVTYTNLHDSSYTEVNGIKTPISKIVITYSNLKRNPQNKGNSELLIFNDPNVGAAIGNAKSIDISNIQFYDQNGKEIQYTPGTAWVEFGSLNAYNNHIEKVGAGNGNKIYQFAEPKSTPIWATKHSDGFIYHDKSNAADASQCLKHGDDGIGIVRLTPGGTITLEYEQDAYWGQFTKGPNNAWGLNGGANADWYQFAMSSFMNAVSNPAPHRKMATIHYHYDVAEKEAKLER